MITPLISMIIATLVTILSCYVTHKAVKQYAEMELERNILWELARLQNLIITEAQKYVLDKDHRKMMADFTTKLMDEFDKKYPPQECPCPKCKQQRQNVTSAS